MRKNIKWIGLYGLTVWLGVASIQPQHALAKRSSRQLRTITQGIQNFYQGVDTLCTHFKQIFKLPRFTRKQKATGQFFYKKPGMLRFYYKKPEKKHYIYNGALKKLWMYLPEDEEVKIRNNMSRDQFGIAFQFLWGGGKMHKLFRVQYAKRVRFGKKGDILLKLIPKKPQTLFKDLYFAVEPRTYRIRETIYTDAAGNKNRFIFSRMKINQKCRLKNKHFVFKAPKGTQVIQLR